MKNIKYIIVLALVIVLGIVAARHWKTRDELAATDIFGGSSSESDNMNYVDACYIWNTEAGDRAALELSTEDGVNVVGTFDYAPAQKDSKKGAITGTLGNIDDSGTTQDVNVDWTVTGEGVTNTEELIIKLGPSIAKPGFGEMKLSGNKYIYADPSKVSYDITLQQTDCFDLHTQQ